MQLPPRRIAISGLLACWATFVTRFLVQRALFSKGYASAFLHLGETERPKIAYLVLASVPENVVNLGVLMHEHAAGRKRQSILAHSLTMACITILPFYTTLSFDYKIELAKSLTLAAYEAARLLLTTAGMSAIIRYEYPAQHRKSSGESSRKPSRMERLVNGKWTALGFFYLAIYMILQDPFLGNFFFTVHSSLARYNRPLQMGIITPDRIPVHTGSPFLDLLGYYGPKASQALAILTLAIVYLDDLDAVRFAHVVVLYVVPSAWLQIAGTCTVAMDQVVVRALGHAATLAWAAFSLKIVANVALQQSALASASDTKGRATGQVATTSTSTTATVSTTASDDEYIDEPESLAEATPGSGTTGARTTMGETSLRQRHAGDGSGPRRRMDSGGLKRGSPPKRLG